MLYILSDVLILFNFFILNKYRINLHLIILTAIKLVMLKY